MCDDWNMALLECYAASSLIGFDLAWIHIPYTLLDFFLL